MLAVEAAEARAEELLVSHLTPEQRAEYVAVGSVTVVKRGIVWSVLLADLAKILPLVALVALPQSRVVALFALVTVVVAFVPFWLPRLAVACARRRLWILSPRATPVVLTRGRRTRFCAVFREHLPPGDRVLAWKYVIELNEGHFLRRANIRG